MKTPSKEELVSETASLMQVSETQKMKSRLRAKPFNDKLLLKRLRKNPEELNKFKDYVIEEYHKDKDLQNLLSCLKIIVMAQRGAVTKIARESKMQRTGIYKALNGFTNPRIDTFKNILNGIGYDLNIVSLNR